MKLLKTTFQTIAISLILISCGNSERESIRVAIEPTEELIDDLEPKDFSIVLNDMNVDQKEGKDLFQHKYIILKVIEDSLMVDSLDWKTVNKGFFLKHENDLGMEIVSNHDNKLSKIAKPVGFDWAIGNEKYGQWEEREVDSTTTNSNSSRSRHWRSNHSSGIFWYWMLSRRTSQRDYVANRAYNASGRSYYGTNQNGTSTYGTNSAYQKTKRPSFYTRKSTSSTWKSFSKRKSASSSRYNGASSTRSKSGGFGK